MRTTILSDGAWGTAIALLMHAKGHEVALWGPFADYVEQMQRQRRNERFLPGVDLPAELRLTAAMPEALEGAELIFLAAPVPYARDMLAQVAAAGLPSDALLVNLAKGIEMGTLKRMSELVGECLGDNAAYCALSGPSHAEEVSRGVPTAVVVASADTRRAEAVQQAMMNDRFRVYTSDDIVGVELGGALKNVYAIAAGICDGMELGDNPKAALMTRAIAEMARLGEALGGRLETFAGLSGIGDMIVTCCSGHSRNRHVGEELGRGKTLPEVIEAMGMVVAEGVKTSQSAYRLARSIGVESPIIDEVYAGLYEQKDPRAGVRDLMTREARPERD